MVDRPQGQGRGLLRRPSAAVGHNVEGRRSAFEVGRGRKRARSVSRAPRRASLQSTNFTPSSMTQMLSLRISPCTKPSPRRSRAASALASVAPWASSQAAEQSARSRKRCGAASIVRHPMRGLGPVRRQRLRRRAATSSRIAAEHALQIAGPPVHAAMAAPANGRSALR